MLNIKCEECGNDIDLLEKHKEELEKLNKAEIEQVTKKELEKLKKKLEKHHADEIENIKEGQLDEIADLKSKLKVLRSKTSGSDEIVRKQRKELEEFAIEAEKLKKLLNEKDATQKLLQEKIKDQAFNEGKASQQKVLEYKDKIIEEQNKKINELQTSSSRVQQNLQGDILEERVFDELVSIFPNDLIERVKKGANGADIVHKNLNSKGKLLGTILWEVKNASKFSKGWIEKLKADMNEKGANFGVIVSAVTTENVQLPDNIFVIKTNELEILASLLKRVLYESYRSDVMENMGTQRRDLILNYLIKNLGPMVEEQILMIRANEEIYESHKRSSQKLWKQASKAFEIQKKHLFGFWGEVKGIAGNEIKEIPSMEVEDV